MKTHHLAWIALILFVPAVFARLVNERFKDFFELARPSEDRIAWLSL